MKLTGKCKADFEKWYANKWGKCSYITPWVDIEDCYPDEHNFYDLPPSMQYGVYVDFFDSVGIELMVDNYFDAIEGYIVKDCYDWGVYDLNNTTNQMCVIGYTKSRHESREQAILKANEIYNA